MARRRRIILPTDAPYRKVPGWMELADAWAVLCAVWIDDLQEGKTFAGPDTELKVRDAIRRIGQAVNMLLAEINKALGFESPPWMRTGGPDDGRGRGPGRTLP